ncbi:MAG: GPW/gp25 family protein [Candidatus Aminicenantes bacterium]|nr:GPW/gp25 family protein [Candidatus Aminicenantes bacterium]
MNQKKTFAFPFVVDGSGRIGGSGGDEAIRSRIIQVLFTAAGERVHQPEFGSGLFNLVFEPNNTILLSSVEFTVGQALQRWLSDEILVDLVNVRQEEEIITVEVAYTKRTDLSKQAVRIQFK